MISIIVDVMSSAINAIAIPDRSGQRALHVQTDSNDMQAEISGPLQAYVISRALDVDL